MVLRTVQIENLYLSSKAHDGVIRYGFVRAVESANSKIHFKIINLISWPFFTAILYYTQERMSVRSAMERLTQHMPEEHHFIQVDQPVQNWNALLWYGRSVIHTQSTCIANCVQQTAHTIKCIPNKDLV